MASNDKKQRGRPPKAKMEPKLQPTVTVFPSPYKNPQQDELDFEVLQQIIEIEERSRQIEMDATYASNISVMSDNSNSIVDPEMADILEQIRRMEQGPLANPHMSDRQRKLEEDRLIKEEQEASYLASLAADREKELAKLKALEKHIDDQLEAEEAEDVMEEYEKYQENDHEDDNNNDNDNDNDKEEEIQPVPQTVEELRLARLKRFAMK